MAIVTKTKSKAVTKPVPTLPKVEIEDFPDLALEAMVDTYGSLEEQHRALLANPIVAQYEAIRKALLGRLATEFEPLEELEITGETYQAKIGAAMRTPASIGDMHLLRKYMGDNVFMACAKVTLTDAKAYLTPEQLNSVLNPGTTYTNRRDIKVKRIS